MNTLDSASGDYATALGFGTTASGENSLTTGKYTTAQRKSQVAIGEYNVLDTTGADGRERGDYAFIVGNGTTTSNRSNAFTVDWDGNVVASKDVSADNITASGDITATGNVYGANIGDKTEDVPSAVSCGHGKYHKIASITLSAGLWIVNTTAQYAATNTTGFRDIYTTTDTFTSGTSTAPQNYAMRTRSVLPAGNYVEYPNATFPVEVASTTTFNLVGHHNAGTNISVTGRMYAVRIK